MGKDFNDADKDKFSKGGDTMAKINAGMMAIMAKKKDGMHKMPDGKMMKNSAMNMGGMAYAKGGSASSRADGVATKGKTQGKMIKMNKGGMAC